MGPGALALGIIEACRYSNDRHSNGIIFLSQAYDVSFLDTSLPFSESPILSTLGVLICKDPY